MGLIIRCPRNSREWERIWGNVSGSVSSRAPEDARAWRAWGAAPSRAAPPKFEGMGANLVEFEAAAPSRATPPKFEGMGANLGEFEATAPSRVTPPKRLAHTPLPLRIRGNESEFGGV